MQDLAGAGVTAIEQKQLVVRILASDLFHKSHRLSAFLKFICEQYSYGQANTINEQRIGTEVFGRPAGYHVGEDSIVRSQARFLRQRLEEYFATEGSQEPIILCIPKGSYVPAFERRDAQAKGVPATPIPLPAVSDPLPPEAKVRTSVRSLAWNQLLHGTSIVTMVILAGLLYRSRTLEKTPRRSETSAVRAFWGSLFHPERTVLIVPADSTLVLMEEVTGKPVRLLSYIKKDYLNVTPPQGSPVWAMLVGSQYTSMADLNLVDHLERVPEATDSHLQIRYARDLSLKELKDGNSILIGGLRSNPWVELFASTVTFDVDFDEATHHNVVRDRAPDPHGQAVYVEDTSGTSEDSHAYGVVAYIPSLDNQGNTLLVEGTSKAGTEAAAEFLVSPAFAQFLHQIGSTETMVPHFEVLLSTGSVGGGSYHPAIVCWRPLGKGPSV